MTMFLMLFDPVVLLDPERRVLKMLLEISSSSLSRRQVLPHLHLMLEKLQMIVNECFIDPARAQFLKTFTKTPSASSQADLGEGGAKVAFSFSGLRHAVGGA